MNQPSLKAVFRSNRGLRNAQSFNLNRHAHWFVLGIGLIISLAAFFITNVLVQKMLEAEHEKMTRQFLGLYMSDLEKQRSAVDEIYHYLRIAYSEDSITSTVSSDVFSSVASFDKFSFVGLYFQKNGRGYFYPIKSENGWQTSGISIADQTQNSIFMPLLENEKLIDESPKFFADKDIFKNLSFLMEDARYPFAFLKKAPMFFSQEAVLIAIGDLSKVWGTGAYSNEAPIANIEFKNAVTSYKFFASRSNTLIDNGSLFPKQTHNLSFGELKWGITTQFYKTNLVLFVSLFPILCTAFVFIGSLILTFYVFREARQAAKTSYMNYVLEDKNSALQAEIDKRSSLYQDLKKSERENKILIDSISDIIFEIDAKGHITYVNASWPRITGFSVMQAMNKSLFSLLNQQDQAREKKSFDMLISGQKSAYRSFTRLRNADGSFRAVELSISMVHRHADGDIRVVGAITDIEDRRRAEQALGEAEKRYRAIVENAAWGIYQMTPEGIYLSVNSSLVSILGYSDAEEMLNQIRNAHDQVYGGARERLLFLREVDMREAVNHRETQVYNKDGNPIWVTENIRAVKDDAGTVLYYEGSLEDITARKESDLLLREAKMQSDMANRAKSEFLTNMSHELRTPLNAIIGFSDIIKKESFGPLGHESYYEYVNDIHNSGKHLLDIINEILEISRIEVRERDLNEELLDISDIMKACLDLVSNKMHANQIDSLNMLGDMPRVIIEERAFKQIFTNILSNAVKFTPRGGRITLHSDLLATGELSVSITDTGIGLEPDQIKKVLSPFGQVASNLDKENSGTGLGLTLVKALVDLHEGKLEIFSQKGVGTTVSIILPAKRVQQDLPAKDNMAQFMPDMDQSDYIA